MLSRCPTRFTPSSSNAELSIVARREPLIPAASKFPLYSGMKRDSSQSDTSFEVHCCSGLALNSLGPLALVGSTGSGGCGGLLVGLSTEPLQTLPVPPGGVFISGECLGLLLVSVDSVFGRTSRDVAEVALLDTPLCDAPGVEYPSFSASFEFLRVPVADTAC